MTTLGGVTIDSSATAREAFSHDAWPRTRKLGPGQPLVDGVARPTSAAEVASILQEATVRGIRVTPVGLRSGICGALVPGRGEIALDLTGMNAIEEIDERSLRVRAQAGIDGGTLEAALAGHGLTLGHHPQSLEISSLGGWIATRSSGLASTRHGSIEQHLIGAQIALADGTLAELPAWPRASVGPDLCQLFIGSEGTLGVICAATLRVHRAPQRRALEAWALPSYDAGLAAIRSFLQDGVSPAVVRLYNPDEATRFHATPIGALLILAHEGLERLVECERELVAERLLAAGGARLSDDPAVRWWGHRFDASALLAYADRPGGIADAIEVAADWTAIGPLVQRLDEDLRPLCTTFHLHGSHFYRDGASAYAILYLDGAGDAAAVELYDRAWELAMRACLETGGAISHHHGVGRVRLPWLGAALGSSGELLRRVQLALDPDGLLSHGRLRPPQ